MSELKNIHQRLAEAMQKVKYVQKEKKQGMQYSIVSHDRVTALVRPALLEAGIVYYPVSMQHVQNGNRTEVSLSVRFVNIDNPEDCFEVPALGFGIDQQDKGPGKGISYAVKYALLKALGLETGDDPDQDQNVRHEIDTSTAERALRECEDMTMLQKTWRAITEDERRALEGVKEEMKQALKIPA